MHDPRELSGRQVQLGNNGPALFDEKGDAAEQNQPAYVTGGGRTKD
jgi:hypothetical protein